ncbi:MAG: hypothetical protein AAGJ83_05875 [Planctomycetota bacterium]
MICPPTSQFSRTLTNVLRAMTLALLLGGFGLPATGQTTMREVALAARMSVEQLEAARLPDPELTRGQLLERIEELRAYFEEKTTPENAAAWMEYLGVPELLAAIESDQSASVLARDASRIVERSTGLSPGLEILQIVQVRSAASDFANAERYARGEAVIKAIGTQLDRFAESIETTQVFGPEQTRSLMLLLNLLDRTGQQVELQTYARSAFGYNNLNVMIGEDLIGRGINRPVLEETPVRDCILGTRIVGEALLTGSVKANLQPSSDRIRIALELVGHVESRNQGFNGPVRLRTQSTGQVFSSRIMEIAGSGIRFEPAVTTASLQTRINSIEHRLALVRRIARKKAAEQKPLSDCIARRRLIRRVSDSFEQQTSAASSLTAPDWVEEIGPLLQRLNLEEPTRSVRSTDKAVHFDAMLRGRRQIAADRPAPQIPSTPAAVIQVHQSVIDNTIGALLAGRTMTRAKLQKLAERLGQSPKVEGDDEKPFEIDFDLIRPIIFEPMDGKLRLGVRGTRFSQGSRELKRTLEIVSSYQPVRQADGHLFLERVGEVEILFPGRKRLSVQETGLRGAIKKTFAKAFPPKILHEALVVPETVRLQSIRGLEFRVSHLEAADGWLSLGVNEITPNDPMAQP